jgi:hypothetical protein
MAELKDITQEEWDDYRWHDVRTADSAVPVYVRGKKRIPRPNDGYVYDEVSGPSDAEEHWERRKSYE